MSVARGLHASHPDVFQRRLIRVHSPRVLCVSAGVPRSSSFSKYPIRNSRLSSSSSQLSRKRLYQQRNLAADPEQPTNSASVAYQDVGAAERLEIAFAKPEAQPAVDGARSIAAAQPLDLVTEVERRLDADVPTVASTLTAVTGVIFFWRGVWSLLDHYVGDNVGGDIACMLMGLALIFYIRLSGARVGSFWPGS